MKTDLFPVLWLLLTFPNLLAYWMQHFHISSFRTWNRSTGILSPPLTLSVVMLAKAHLTSYSRISGSRWVITPLWLFGSWRSFLPLEWYHPNIWGCWYLSWQSWFQLVTQFSPVFHMMCSAYKLNKQGDNQQPCHIPFSILNQSVVPYRILTILSWPISQETGLLWST